MWRLRRAKQEKQYVWRLVVQLDTGKPRFYAYLSYVANSYHQHLRGICMTNGAEEIRPLRDAVVLELLEEGGKVGQIYVPDQYGDLAPGRVIAVSDMYRTQAPGTGQELSVGDTVLFVKRFKENMILGSNKCIVPLTAIAAVLEGTRPAAPTGSNEFFYLPTWDEFREDDATYETWKEWENMTFFLFRVRFLEPFRNLAPLARRMYEYCIEEVQPRVRDNFAPFELELIEEKKNELQDQSSFAVRCFDDFYGGNMVLNGKERFIDFLQQHTDMRRLVGTAPHWMRAFQKTLSDQLFRSIAGANYERVTLLAITIHQVIKLEGQGARRNQTSPRNSQSMGHFLRFGLMPEEKGMSPTLEQLGIVSPLDESIGRVDLALSFDRKIADKDFNVWFRAEAPLNENSSQIHVKWEIQREYPGVVVDQEHGNILTDFVRDVILKGFYRTWFDQITCATMR